MKILSIKLRNFKRFKNSNIQDLHVRFVNPAQMIVGTNSSGKALPNDTPVKIPGGWKQIGELKVGDIVTAIDGTPTRVLGVFPQGIKRLYQIMLVDGRKARCCEDHLWSVHIQGRNPHEYNVVDTKLLNGWVNARHLAYHLPTCKSEQIPDVNLPLHPYVLGAIIGDGTCSRRPIRLSSDTWIANKIVKLMNGEISLRKSGTNNYKVEYTGEYDLIPSNPGEKNIITEALIELGIFGQRSWEKQIPVQYLYASTEQRLQLLQGLMDTDGYISMQNKAESNTYQSTGSIEYSTTSKILAEQVQYLIRSIGGICRIKEKAPIFTYKGERRNGRIAYVLRIRVPVPGDIFTLPRKRNRLHKDGKNMYSDVFKLKIHNMCRLPDKAECTCIYVEHPSHQFIINDFIVTHNTSLLMELCPLPPVRTDFEHHIGYKELIIEHQGHQFQLISDFSSRTAPHKFIMDNSELNASGTTDVQTNLVEKYFGITPAIRDLVYQKVQVCNLQRAQRKNLFLNINPLELGLILDTHKKAVTRVKDCKANLQHLYTRKADIEGKLLEPSILEQHKTTKQQLTDQLMNIDKVIYALEQHVLGLKDRYREDLEYKQQCSDNNQVLIPVQSILSGCKEILSHIERYTPVKRGTSFTQEREKMRVELDTLDRRKSDIEKSVRNLSDEVNEYQKHLEEASGKSVSNVEKELKKVDKELEKYQHLPELPIPQQQIESALKTIEKIRQLCFVFSELETTLIPIDILQKKIEQEQSLRQQATMLNSEQSRLKSYLEQQEKELLNIKLSAGIPDSCTSTDCGLRTTFAKRNENIQKDYDEKKQRYNTQEKELKQIQEKLLSLQKEVEPFVRIDIVGKYQELVRLLDNMYFASICKWDEKLFDYLKEQPLKIVADLMEYVEGSKLAHERDKFLQQKQQLTTELQVLLKSAGTSRQFLQKQITAKEKQIKEQMSQLSSIEKRTEILQSEYALYLEYAQTVSQVQEWENTFTKGERALLVSKAIQYWSALGKFMVELKKHISEELRTIETIVRDQEVLIATYNNEIITHIGKIEEEKKVYEHIEMALSPTTGMPHKSMVKYLNAMIANVNFFLSQIWTSKLKILPVAEDQPLDYSFRVEVNHDYGGDISQLSSGQTEILNFAWTMTILLQLKLLNKIPFFADELGRTLDPMHRQKLLIFLNNAVSSGLIEQLFLVNHYAAMITGFTDADIICLDDSNLIDLPQNVNENVQIVHYGDKQVI